MQTLRVRIKEKLYKDVEKKNGLTIVRWDSSKEIMQVPSKKKGEEPVSKETGHLICSERVYHGDVTKEMVQKDIDADLAVRYKDGEKPSIVAPEV